MMQKAAAFINTEHPVFSSCFDHSLLVCTITWACVLSFCVTDLHILQ